jgi:hypothetical protein
VEINNIAAICVPGRPTSIPDITVIEVELPSSELRVMRGRSGIFKALVMPRFISTIVEQVRLPLEEKEERKKRIGIDEEGQEGERV